MVYAYIPVNYKIEPILTKKTESYIKLIGLINFR